MTDIPGESRLSYASSSSPQSAPELVAFADCEIVPINTGMTLVINRQNGKQQILSPQVVEGMKTCTAFRTIEEHAAHLAKTRAELNGQESMANFMKANGTTEKQTE